MILIRLAKFLTAVFLAAETGNAVILEKLLKARWSSSRPWRLS